MALVNFKKMIELKSFKLEKELGVLQAWAEDTVEIVKNLSAETFPNPASLRKLAEKMAFIRESTDDVDALYEDLMELYHNQRGQSRRVNEGDL